MKKQLLILGLAVLTLGSAAAQSVPSYKEKSIHYWDEGPLTEADFSVRHLAATLGDMTGELSWGISFDPVTDKIGNLRYTHPVTRTYMDQLQSWMDPNLRQPWTLNYFQTEFDLLESFRRKMQLEIDENPMDYNEIRDYYERAIHSAVDAFRLESDLGRDAGAVARNEVQYKEALDTLKAGTPAKEPQVRRRLVGEGLFFGYLCEFYGDPVSAGIGPSHGFNLGISFPISKVYLALDMTMGRPGVLKQEGFYYDSHKDYTWRKGVKCEAGQMNLLAGYTVLDRPAFALRPVAGIGVGFLDQETENKNTNGSYLDSEIHGFRSTVGAQLAIKLRRTLAISSYSGGGYGETSLVFKAYASHTQFQGLGPVWSANLGVVLDWSGWLLKRNDPMVR